MTGAMLAAVLVGVTGGSDVTPAAVDWANISGGSIGFTDAKTISDINTAISLQVTFTGTDLDGFYYQINSGALVMIASGGSFSVSNTNTVAYAAIASVVASGTVTITNLSDGSTVLDTFTYAMFPGR